MGKINQLKINIAEEEKVKYYTAFSYLQVKPIFKSRLFEYFEYDIKRAFLADKNDIQSMAEYYDISSPRDFLEKKDKLNIEECFKNAFLDKNVKILTYEDEKYPPLLKEIPDFPLALFYKGDINKVNYDFNLAVVGSRKASENAKIALDSVISGLKNSPITIVSGLAYGIDAKAHTSAIENNLKTIGVIASGLDTIYPMQNKGIYEKIIDEAGVIFSEYPLGVKPIQMNFPQRNRIVVGMSKGTLVGEAQVKSGAMISANLTLDYDRELMCIPGNILNPNTSGIYHLIKNGASIICNSDDLLNSMGWAIIHNEKENEKNELSDFQKEVLEIVSMEEKTFDEIVCAIKEDVSKIMVVLTELELKGLIKQTNNKYYKCK